MDLFARIRRDARVEGLGTRKLAARYSVGRNTVRRALQSAEPPTRTAASNKVAPLDTAAAIAACNAVRVSASSVTGAPA